MSITENPIGARFGRRINSFVIVRSKKRAHASATLLDGEKYPHRMGIYGHFLVASIVTKEFDPNITKYEPNVNFEQQDAIPLEQRAIDPYVPIVSTFLDKTERWELCAEDEDAAPLRSDRLHRVKERAEAAGAQFSVFTENDAKRVGQRCANSLILNAMIRGAPVELYDYRIEHEAIIDVVMRRGRTNLLELLEVVECDPAKVMSETARLIRDGIVRVDIDRKRFSLVSALELNG